MHRQATALAHPNIALAKYWGKTPGADNAPAVPSLSVTLAGMCTRTTVSFDVLGPFEAALTHSFGGMVAALCPEEFPEAGRR